MKLLSYLPEEAGGASLPGLMLGNEVLPIAKLTPFQSMQALIEAGTGGRAAIAQAINIHVKSGSGKVLMPLDGLKLAAPLPRPQGLRDFYAFEQHVKAANANRGRPVPEGWYRFPVFYYTNPNSIYGPGDVVPYPSYTAALDYELEIACIIGKAGKNIPVEEAEEYIFGYTIFNDWSARDIQRQEMQVGLGPAKGKDFASSLGPWIVTIDELGPRHAGRPGVFDLPMRARVNGELRSEGNFKDIFYSFGEMIAHASKDAWLFPGEVFGSGTVGSGCLLELTKGEGPWLEPGDEVALEIEGIGALVNTISTPFD